MQIVISAFKESLAQRLVHAVTRRRVDARMNYAEKQSPTCARGQEKNKVRAYGRRYEWRYERGYEFVERHNFSFQSALNLWRAVRRRALYRFLNLLEDQIFQSL